MCIVLCSFFSMHKIVQHADADKIPNLTQHPKRFVDRLFLIHFYSFAWLVSGFHMIQSSLKILTNSLRGRIYFPITRAIADPLILCFVLSAGLKI